MRPAFQARRWSRLGAVLALLLLGSPALRPSLPAAPERFDVFDVFVGFDGLIGEGSWFPVVCEIENKGPSFNATFELSSRYDDQVHQMPLELPTGTRKRFVLPVFSPGRYRSEWEAHLRDERRQIRAEAMVRTVRRQLRFDMPVIGALSRTASGRPVFPEPESGNVNEYKLEAARLTPDLFPDSPIALEGLDVLYLSSAQATEDRLRVGQVNALVAWLHAGGHLIVGVEQLAQINGAPWLRQLLPCSLDRTVTLTNLAPFHAWLQDPRRVTGRPYSYAGPDPAGSEPGAPTPPTQRPPPNPLRNPFQGLPQDASFEQSALTIAAGQLLDGEVVASANGEPLILTARRGRGRLTVLTFGPEFEPFLSWRNRPHFWAKLTDVPLEWIPPNTPPNRYANQSIDSAFGAMIDSRQVRKLPVGWLLLLLVGYLVVIGPLDRWWLKKINRPMLTWLTFPAYVVCFSLLIYFIGYKLRAGESEWNELHVVDVLPQRAEAALHGRTFASIYSPANARYELECELPFAALRGELLRQHQAGREASRASLLHRGNSFAAGIFVPVWTSQLYVNNWWNPAALPLAARVERTARGFTIDVENLQDQTLTDARLVVDGLVFELGQLPAGQTSTFSFDRARGTDLATFVNRHAGHFRDAINQRARAFGQNVRAFPDLALSSMAASFVSEIEGSGWFLSPPGFDLKPLVVEGDAVLLAWAPDHAPVPPIHQFQPRRSARNTLWRLAFPLAP